MSKKSQKTVKITKKDDSKIFAVLGIILTIIGYFIVVLTRKEDKYALYYAKQGLALFIACLIAGAASWVIGWIPIIGDIAVTVLWALIFALWIIGIIYSLSGEEKEIPIVGKFGKKF